MVVAYAQSGVVTGLGHGYGYGYGYGGTESTYFPVAPDRILNTFTGVGAPQGTVGPAEEIEVDVTTGDVPDDATAVVLNVTVTGADIPTTPPPSGSAGLSYLSVTPEGGNDTSNLNFRGLNAGGQDIAALVKVPVGTGGTVHIYNDKGETYIIADVFGYYAADDGGARFTGVDPARVLEPTQVQEADDITVDVTTGDVPANASAVAINVTVSGATEDSFLSVTPSGGSETSNLNFRPVPTGGQDIANLVIVPVDPDGTVNIFNDSGAPFVIVDVFGYYGPPGDAAGDGFTPLTPDRILNTVDGTGGTGSGSLGRVAAGETITVDVTDVGGVPANATAVVLNVTVTGADIPNVAPPTGSGGLSFLSVTPAGGEDTSNLNFKSAAPPLNGQDIANLVVVPVGADGNVRIFNDSGVTHVIADVFGYFRP